MVEAKGVSDCLHKTEKKIFEIGLIGSTRSVPHAPRPAHPAHAAAGNVREYYAARLKKRFPELEIDVADHFSKATPLAPNADILLTFGPMMRDEVFANAPKLKWVQALGTGVDGVTDQPSLGKNVTVTNIRGIHGAPVSEAAIMGMLALCRDLPRSVRSQDQNSWTRWAPKLIDSKTVGIYGIGLIAEALAPRLQGVRHDGLGFTSTSREVPGFDRMLLRSELLQHIGEGLDYLVLLVPYSEETRHSIGADVFAAMKPTAISINLARGGVVDEDAMMAALKAGKIAGAALDVFQTEPLPSDHRCGR